MKLEVLKKILIAENQLHRIKIYAKKRRERVVLWSSYNYKRSSLNLPSIRITDKSSSIYELDILKKAVEMRNALEAAL